MVWLTSDHHFGHANIIKYCNRPYSTVGGMDRDLIYRWNCVVKDADTVFHLGDFTLGNLSVARMYFAQLKGRIHVVSCNWHHDYRWLPNNRPFLDGCTSLSGRGVVAVGPMYVLNLPEYSPDGVHSRRLTLSHYPLRVWDVQHYGGWHAHGHTHRNLDWPAGSLVKHVGVDTCNFTPISIKAFAKEMLEIEDKGVVNEGVPG